ncbi:hypothetical protein GCM10027451_01010 [Geodermatophilus aquaeductus]|uniref:YdhG-like domain-containing protein n=1 Tax=Geodermatophilus aquaeductus TaxID=1564161 RepID=A0A521CRR4_9ACTN|nr:DUF1801 domain-containing protein [Geodermatophilus aquaeductus]SMO62143.1 protein of unknown function (DU1801) [Geodermatophilus aquaeductus]
MRDPGVDTLLAGSDHAMVPAVQRLRTALLDDVDGLSEHVKWRSPTFLHGGADRLTVDLSRAGRAVLVFHRGARVRADFTFADPTGLMGWRGPDRALVTYTDATALDAAVPVLTGLVRDWVRA